MAKARTVETITDRQIQRASEFFLHRCRANAALLPREIVRDVLEEEGDALAQGMFEALRVRVARREAQHSRETLAGVLANVDPSVRIWPTFRMPYPRRMEELLHPDLAEVGPITFKVTDLKAFYLNPDDDEVATNGVPIYEHLKTGGLLAHCLGLRDLEAIQRQGIAFFRQFYHGKAVLGWKSIGKFEQGLLRVPYLYENQGKVTIGWRWLEHTFFPDKYLTLHFEVAA